MKYLLSIIGFFFFTLCSVAQDLADKEITTGLRADGKIYVVVAVIVTLLVGFVIYLISLDRKITRFEKEFR